MAAITIKNIPDDLYEMLKNRAKLNHRSINNEVIYTLKSAVHLGSADDMAELRKRVAEFREKIAARGGLTPEEIEKAITEGRR